MWEGVRMVKLKDVAELRKGLRGYSELTGHAAQLHHRSDNIIKGVKQAKKLKKEVRARINQIKKIFDLASKHEHMKPSEVQRKKLIKEFTLIIKIEAELIKIIEKYG